MINFLNKIVRITATLFLIYSSSSNAGFFDDLNNQLEKIGSEVQKKARIFSREEDKKTSGPESSVQTSNVKNVVDEAPEKEKPVAIQESSINRRAEGQSPDVYIIESPNPDFIRSLSFLAHEGRILNTGLPLGYEDNLEVSRVKLIQEQKMKRDGLSALLHLKRYAHLLNVERLKSEYEPTETFGYSNENKVEKSWYRFFHFIGRRLISEKSFPDYFCGPGLPCRRDTGAYLWKGENVFEKRKVYFSFLDNHLNVLLEMANRISSPFPVYTAGTVHISDYNFDKKGFYFKVGGSEFWYYGRNTASGHQVFFPMEQSKARDFYEKIGSESHRKSTGYNGFFFLRPMIWATEKTSQKSFENASSLVVTLVLKTTENDIVEVCWDATCGNKFTDLDLSSNK